MTRWQPAAPIVGAADGLLDAIGGGGWGPLVSSILVARGDSPRRTVGSVNLAEFFITVSVSITFFTQLDFAEYGKLVLGLIAGGALAAPMAGYLLRIMPTRIALILVGTVVAGLSLINLISLFVPDAQSIVGGSICSRPRRVGTPQSETVATRRSACTLAGRCRTVSYRY